MKVLAFKMTSGEEVLARVNSTKELNGTEVSYNVESPMTLVVGQRGLALIPWTLSNPDITSVAIPASQVIVAFPPAEDIEKQYLQQTSKIALA